MKNSNRRKKTWLFVSAGTLILLSVFVLHHKYWNYYKPDTSIVCNQLSIDSQTPKRVDLSLYKALKTIESKLPQKQTASNDTMPKASLATIMPSTAVKHKEAASDNSFEIDSLLDNLPLPLPSLSPLPYEEEKKAVDFFESQHRSWLATKSGSARYITILSGIRDGEFTQYPPLRIGTLDFVITSNIPEGHKSPVKIQAHLFDEMSKSHSVSNDVLDWEMRWWQWTEDPTFPIYRAKQVYNTFQIELLFLPLDFMAKTYSDGSWHNKYMTSKEDFFAYHGVPRRRSTEEETKQIFGGEPQYLFMANPEVVDVHYWFSAENGELRQIDVFSPDEDKVRSFRYEYYVQDEDAKFPRKFTLTCKWKEGDSIKGLRHTIYFSDVKLNIDIPAERFIVPELNY